MFLNEVKFNLRMRIALFFEVLLSNNNMSSLRTTNCDALIVPSVYLQSFLLIPLVVPLCPRQDLDGRADTCTDEQTDKAVTTCFPFGENNKQELS